MIRAFEQWILSVLIYLQVLSMYYYHRFYIFRVLEKQLSLMRSDEDVIAELAKETFTRDEYNAYNVRLGQRTLIQNALQYLKS